RTGASQKASSKAAVAAAAHDTLVSLYPQLKDKLDIRLEESLAQIPDGSRKRLGIRVGQEVARRMLALRRNDDSDAQLLPFTPGVTPGDYQLTPPNFSQPVFTHWPFVKPFTLSDANQFRPSPPPALTSAEYTSAFQEIKELGVVDSSTRTADQTESGAFWRAPIQNYWNEIAQTAALAHGTTLAQNARLFALLNLTFADGAISFYDAKYFYNFWRPVTAVRGADTDNNPETIADPNWTPQFATALDPSYPGAHSVISSAGATILSSFFDRDDFRFSVRSEVLPGVERSFTRFTAAAEDAGLSRIYAGQHFRFDHLAGQNQGRKIARHVFRNFLVPRRHNDDDNDDRRDDHRDDRRDDH
ncbi:MAG: vanadium-dependent haloperoxidase, partial [Pyrinomonadaceae bacterium]